MQGFRSVLPRIVRCLLVLALLGGYVSLEVGTASADPMPDEETKLTADDAASVDLFGSSAAISGDTAVVGAPGDDDDGSGSGSAYLFVRDGTDWIQQQKLTASDAALGDSFGNSVAISGDTLVVAASFDTDAGSASGSAYVFVRSGTTWTEQQKLTASDAAVGDRFGCSISIDGDTVVVGAFVDDDAGTNSGSAYVFVRSGTTWSQQQKLTASDAAAFDQFGGSVSISGNTVVVGSQFDDDAGSASGSAYVFVRSGTSWSQQQKLAASDAAADDLFGLSVSIDGETAVVSAPLNSDAGPLSGSAYVFVRSGTTWSEQQKLTASDAAAQARFGYSVSISGNTAMVSADFDDFNAGSAYVFERSGTTWSEQQKLTASDAAPSAFFGNSVSIDGETKVVGAYLANVFSGAAYVFVPSNSDPDCSAAEADPHLIFLPLLITFCPVDVEGVTDPDGDPVTITISSIRQDEHFGLLHPDGTGVGNSIAYVRAEANLLGNGRVYHIGFDASDGLGGTCSGSVKVGVIPLLGTPPAVDNGSLYDSTH